MGYESTKEYLERKRRANREAARAQADARREAHIARQRAAAPQALENVGRLLEANAPRHGAFAEGLGALLDRGGPAEIQREISATRATGHTARLGGARAPAPDKSKERAPGGRVTVKGLAALMQQRAGITPGITTKEAPPVRVKAITGDNVTELVKSYSEACADVMALKEIGDGTKRDIVNRLTAEFERCVYDGTRRMYGLHRRQVAGAIRRATLAVGLDW